MFSLNTVIAWHKTYYKYYIYDNKVFIYFPLGHISETHNRCTNHMCKQRAKWIHVSKLRDLSGAG
jgi:hypothetical protein